MSNVINFQNNASIYRSSVPRTPPLTKHSSADFFISIYTLFITVCYLFSSVYSRFSNNYKFLIVPRSTRFMHPINICLLHNRRVFFFLNKFLMSTKPMKIIVTIINFLFRGLVYFFAYLFPSIKNRFARNETDLIDRS